MRTFLLSLSISLFSLFNLFAQPYSWEPRGIGGGKAFYAPCINPNNSNEYYVSSDMSGFYHTTVFGKRYNLVDFRTIQGGVNTFVRFTKDPNLTYAIKRIGENYYPAKSTNSGYSWDSLKGNPVQVFDNIYTIFADFNNPERVVISSFTEIFFSKDSGNTFTSIYSTSDDLNGVLVAGAFFDNDNIYIGTSDGLLESTDGGSNFTMRQTPGISPGEKIISMAGAKQGNTTRLFCITAEGSNVLPGLQGDDYVDIPPLGIYSLEIGTLQWQSRTNGIDLLTDSPMFVAMAENNINIIYLAGSSYGIPIVIKSTDGGTTWNHVFITNNNQNIYTGWCGDGGDYDWSYAECVLGIDVLRDNPNKLVITDKGFVHTSTDGGATWHEAYTEGENPSGDTISKGKFYISIGLENMSCWLVYMINYQFLIAACSDIKMIQSQESGQTWNFNYSGINANTVYRITGNKYNSMIYAATSNVPDLYQSTKLKDNPLDSVDTEGKIIYSTDFGATWQDLHYFGHPVFWLAIDPSDTNRMYASVVHSTEGGIYVTNDLQDSTASIWTKLPNPPRTEGHPASIEVLKDGTIVCTYSGHIVNNQFTPSSGCFFYSSASQQWTDVSQSDMYYWCKDVVIDPKNDNNWFVCIFSGQLENAIGKGGLFQTTDRGSNWTRINNLDRVTSLSKTYNNFLYLTTETDGLWLNKSFSNFYQLQNYPFRQPERMLYDYLYIFQPNNNEETFWVTNYGNGLLYNVTLTNVIDTSKILNDSRIYISPNPTSDLIRITLNNIANTKLQIKIYNVLGNVMRSLNCGFVESGSIPITVDVKDFPSGVYYVSAITPAGTTTGIMEVTR
jgi:hypothetical protein